MIFPLCLLHHFVSKYFHSNFHFHLIESLDICLLYRKKFRIQEKKQANHVHHSIKIGIGVCFFSNFFVTLFFRRWIELFLHPANVALNGNLFMSWICDWVDCVLTKSRFIRDGRKYCMKRARFKSIWLHRWESMWYTMDIGERTVLLLFIVRSELEKVQ